MDALHAGDATLEPQPAVLAQGIVGWIRPGSALSAQADPREWLAGAPPITLRSVAGRETFAWPFVRSDSGDPRQPVIVKRTRGDAGRVRAAGRREFENLDSLARDGFRVPRALAWCEERGGRLPSLRGRLSCVVMERIPHTATLRDELALAERGEQHRLALALLDVVVRLHERGWYHRDLYLQHVVLPEGPAAAEPDLVLLDVARARRERSPRMRWFVKDLAALLHSTPRAVGTRARLRFLAAYLDRRRVDARAERRRWLSHIIAKQRRMAAHEPRQGEDRPWRDL